MASVRRALKSLRGSLKEPVQSAFAWAATLPLDRRPRTTADLAQFEPKAIVAARTDRVGDLLVSTPLLAALHDRWPAARLVLVHGPRNRSVLPGLPFVEPGPEFRRDPLSWTRVASWLVAQRFDLAVSLRAEGMADVYVAAWSGAPVRLATHGTKTRAAYNLIIGEEIRHHVTRHCHAAAAIGAPREHPRPVFIVPRAAEEQGHQILRALHARGGGPLVGVQIPNRSSRHHIKRAWPLERLIAAVRSLVADGTRVMLCAVGSERADAARVAAAVPEAMVGPEVPLAVLAALQRGFDLFISGFTGPSHLAAAIGTPSLIIGTATLAEYWRPLEPIHRTVLAPRVSDVSVEAVLAAAREVLSGDRPRAGVPENACEG